MGGRFARRTDYTLNLSGVPYFSVREDPVPVLSRPRRPWMRPEIRTAGEAQD